MPRKSRALPGSIPASCSAGVSSFAGQRSQDRDFAPVTPPVIEIEFATGPGWRMTGSIVASAVSTLITALAKPNRFLDEGRRASPTMPPSGHEPSPGPMWAPAAPLPSTPWLADELARLPDHPAKRIDELLPWHWCGSQRQAA
jgi:hypothetical protein